MVGESDIQTYTVIAIVLSALLIYTLNQFKNSNMPAMGYTPRERRVNTGKRNVLGEEIWKTERIPDEEYKIMLRNTRIEYYKKMTLYLIIYLLPIVFIILTAFVVLNLFIGIVFFILAIISTVITQIVIKFYSSHFSGGFEY